MDDRKIETMTVIQDLDVGDKSDFIRFIRIVLDASLQERRKKWRVWRCRISFLFFPFFSSHSCPFSLVVREEALLVTHSNRIVIWHVDESKMLFPYFIVCCVEMEIGFRSCMC